MVCPAGQYAMWLQEHILMVTPTHRRLTSQVPIYYSFNVGYIRNVYSKRGISAGREACMSSYRTSKCCYRSVPGKRPRALNHKPSFFTILGTYSVQQLKEAGSITMGVALARYAHTRICTLYIEHVCMIFRPSARATRKEYSYA